MDRELCSRFNQKGLFGVVLKQASLSRDRAS
jgi:hypothetical protein